MTRNFKISIRISIMILFVFLLSLIGSTIIGINYIAVNKILNNGAKYLIVKTSLLVNERFQVYLQSLSHNLIEIRGVISNNILDPKDSKLFELFLFEMIRYKPEIFMIHYGLTDGDFYNINRGEKKDLELIHIENSKPPFINTRYELNEEGQIIAEKSMTIPYDPRSRPWYQDAVNNGKPLWTNIYEFYLFGKRPGIAVSAPIYDKNKQLKGVVAVALTLQHLQKFIKELELTKNTLIFVINNKRDIIAFYNHQHQDDIRGETLDSALLKKFNIPSAILNDQLQTQISSYVYNKQRYFFSYQSILNTLGIDPWSILIITPENDVTQSLKSLSTVYIVLTLFVLLVGAILVLLVAQKIANPIIQLAKEVSCHNRRVSQ